MLRKIMLAVGTALLPTIALAATIDVTTADIPVGGNVEWTADNEYVLNGLVFVSEGASLTIQPGTVIKGKPGQGENASALVVARGGKIFAEGTADKPIIFTAEADDVSNANDLPLDARGLWGGVIILGRASLKFPRQVKLPLRAFPPPSRAASTAATTTATTPVSFATRPSVTAVLTSARATKSTA